MEGTELGKFTVDVSERRSKKLVVEAKDPHDAIFKVQQERMQGKHNLAKEPDCMVSFSVKCGPMQGQDVMVSQPQPGMPR